MSDIPPTPSPGWTTPRIAGVALGFGILAGVFGIYVTGMLPGNDASAAACPADAPLAAALDEASGGEVAGVLPLETPFSVADIAFEDESGAPASLADFAGRALLVNLWATWCAPCRAEMPALDELERLQGGEDFAVVPINVDMGDAEKPRAFYTETGLSALPFFRDETMGVFNDLKSEGVAFGLPVTLLVDEEGCARAALNGPAEWASPDALRLVETLKGGV